MKARHSIRFKLLLLSLVLLVIPLSGYRFIQQMEHFLRQAQDDNLLTTTRALALAVKNSGLLEQYPATQNALYVHPYQSVILDGFADDWQLLLPLAQRFESGPGPAFSVLLRASASDYYLLLQVRDSNLVYAGSLGIGVDQSDRVELYFDGDYGLQHWLITPYAPGSVHPQLLSPIPPVQGRLRGEWQETPQGYTLELRIPRSWMRNGLKLAVTDLNQGRMLTNFSSPAQLNPLIQPDTELEVLLQQQALPGSRLWVVDRQGWVLARQGSTGQRQTRSSVPWIIEKALNLMLRHQGATGTVFQRNAIRLDAEPVRSALHGQANISRSQPAGQETLNIAVAAPIRNSGNIVGAVVLEQDTEAILSLQNQALQELILLSFGVFIPVAMILLVFASGLVSRIHRLHRQLEQSVAADGRILGPIQAAATGDEIGQLSRSLSNVLLRLGEYNQYLERMSSSLLHELRTPLSIVSSSLDNCQESPDVTAQKTFLSRAQKAVQRMQLLLRQMQQATRLEKALENVQRQNLNLCELLRFSLDSYSSIHPGLLIELQPCPPLKARVAPELIHQALEKLLDNARSFQQPDTPIRVFMQTHDEYCEILVCNQGSQLPEGEDLFHATFSQREKKTRQPHLGLGLYLVKLIAGFHRGGVLAYNLPHQQGVCIGFSIRMSD